MHAKQYLPQPDLIVPFIQPAIDHCPVKDLSQATTREIAAIVNEVEAQSNYQFVRMEMGVPGLLPDQVAIQAEMKAHSEGKSAIYPRIDGIPELKEEASRFLKNFVNIDISSRGCIPTVGAMQAAMATFLVTGRTNRMRPATLFIDPGFPMPKRQLELLNMPYEAFDIYNYRGDKLQAKLESYLKTGRFNSILYSSPNNPSWICLSDEELQIIARVAQQYDVILIEDMAYLGMDTRADYYQPGRAPFPASVAQYTDKYILYLSASKLLNYAGQRIAILAVSDVLYHTHFPDLADFYPYTQFGTALVYGSIFALSSGTNHTAQYGMTALLKAANEGQLKLQTSAQEYARRAHLAKEIMLNNGFQLVYDHDLGKPLADGFYFSFSYPGLSGHDLIEQLLRFGISAISLRTTGSYQHHGARACVSLLNDYMLKLFRQRIEAFHRHQQQSITSQVQKQPVK